MQYTDWTLGLWLRLHTCCILRVQQVQRAVATHFRGRSPAQQHGAPLSRILVCMPYNKQWFITMLESLSGGAQLKSQVKCGIGQCPFYLSSMQSRPRGTDQSLCYSSDKKKKNNCKKIWLTWLSISRWAVFGRQTFPPCVCLGVCAGYSRSAYLHFKRWFIVQNKPIH